MAEEVKYDYKLLFDNKTVGIVIVSKTGRIVEVNEYLCEILGYSKDELLKLNVDDLVPDNQTQKHTHYRHKYTQQPHVRTMGVGMDLYARRKDGSIFPVEISLSPFVKDGKEYTTAFLIDSTIRKVNEEKIKKQNQELNQVKLELQKLNLELEKKVEKRTQALQTTLEELKISKNELSQALEKEKELGELKSRFVSMASHEFRTPLSTILSSSSLISRYIEANSVQNCERHIQRIRSSVEHLNFILEDFLSIGKIEEGLIQENQEKFEINSEIELIVNEMKELAKSGQTIRIYTSAPTYIRSDKHLLKIAISNLLSNAIKFSHEGSIINVRLEEKNKKSYIKVEDFGIGIPYEDQKHLFTRFFRASNSSNIQGTGLGIYIVKRYISIIGGELNFVSVPEKGSTFTIVLPV